MDALYASAVIEELEACFEQLRRRFDVPGVSWALLNDGEIAHAGKHAVPVGGEMQAGRKADAGARAGDDGGFHRGCPRWGS